VCSEIVSCPKCNSTKCVRLWRVEVVLPGDNSDNSTKGWRWVCLNCGADWLERITANDEAHLSDESLRIKRQIPETSEMLELPNDTKIRFCNAFGEILAHCILCKECDLYLRLGDGDLCSTGKAVIALEMCYTDTSIVFPPNAQAEPPEERR
jgi:hypothetical protein